MNKHPATILYREEVDDFHLAIEEVYRLNRRVVLRPVGKLTKRKNEINGVVPAG